jgi:predicted Zn-dependent peptidase
MHTPQYPVYQDTLANGLRVFILPDDSTPLAAVNLLYDVGASDESPERTGFAHLFEHLMFEGSVHIPSFDTPLQMAGGTNNAFTNNDITNYYCTLPANNLETALWLESDRMLALDFSQEKLDIQKKVVIEEFKQRYLNQPYADAWLLIREMAYKVHPYRWATIGQSVEHIEGATLDEVKSFFYTHYAPNNAILTVAGGVDVEQTFTAIKKWFGDIPSRTVPVRNLPLEPPQTERRFLEVTRPVPDDLLVMSFPMVAKSDPSYYAYDLLSDLLGNGASSYLQEVLVRDKRIFNDLSCYISGSRDAGMFMLVGPVQQDYTLAQAEAAVWETLAGFPGWLTEAHLSKVKQQVISRETFERTDLAQMALRLGLSVLRGDMTLAFSEEERYASVQVEDIHRVFQTLQPHVVSALYYRAKK